jgi:predicted nucleotidyltransferase
MNDGLSEKQRTAIQQVLAKFSAVQQAILYGSRAMGSHRPGSDIDLTLVGNIDLQILNQISTELDDLLLPYEIDLSIYKQIDNPQLKDHIQRRGVVFFQQ